MVAPDSSHLNSKLCSFISKHIHDVETHAVPKKGLPKCCTTLALERLQGTEYQFFRVREERLSDCAVLRSTKMASCT